MTFQITVTPQSATQEDTEDKASLVINPDAVPESPPSKSSTDVHPAAISPAKSPPTSISVNIPPQNLTVATKFGENVLNSPSTITPSLSKEEGIVKFPGMRSSPLLGDSGAIRGGRSNISIHFSSGIPLPHGGGPSSGTESRVVLPSENVKRSTLEIGGSFGNTTGQPPLSPLSNRMILPRATRSNDVANEIDGNASEAAIVTSRSFSPSTVSGTQWRPGSPFQNQSETVCSLCNIFI